jgi:acetyl esterase/lipase
VGGDSAGGNLAAVVSQTARDRGGPPLIFQLLVYPVTYHRFDTASYRENADGYFLTKDAMEWLLPAAGPPRALPERVLELGEPQYPLRNGTHAVVVEVDPDTPRSRGSRSARWPVGARSPF